LNDTDFFLVSPVTLKFNEAIYFGKDGEILAQTNIQSGLHPGSSLSHDNGTSFDKFTIKALNA
jgi:hypothetical protein